VAWWLRHRAIGAFVAEIQAASGETEQRVRELDLLTEVTQRILAHNDPGEVLGALALGAAELLGAAIGHISLLTDDGTQLRLAAATGALGQRAGEILPREGSMAGWVVEHGQPLVVDDLRADPRAHAGINQELGLQSGVMVPLLGAGRPVGALGCDNARGARRFGPRDVALMQRLGALAVLVLEQAKLYAETEQARATLEEQNEALGDAIRHKSAFLANMSHELRTPLNAIVGFGDLLGSGAFGTLDATQQDAVDTILRNSRHLLGLINDILDLAKAEAGKLELHLTPTDLREVIDGVLRDTGSLVGQKGHRVTVEAGPESLVVKADGVRIRQILFNLISNAVKFTPDGGEISVRALRTNAPLPVPADRTGDRNPMSSREAVWIAVGDTGPGIKPDDMDRLFQEFSQVDGSAARRFEGTGLGLALCRRFVELHGGQIGAESLYGHGSTFWFILPVHGPIRRISQVNPVGVAILPP
jgi:signal transduction histidine kinase